jgi:hypothetical protein
MIKGFVDKDTAMKIAQEEIDEFARPGDKEWWAPGSQVVDAFPLLMDGIEGTSYWECKVTTEGQDAGYVLVNANQTDLLIPEASLGGLTRTETYRERLGAADFAVTRYDWVRSTAVRSPEALARSPGAAETILATDGFEVAGKAAGTRDLTAAPGQWARQTMKRYRSTTRDRGAFPLYPKILLQAYYRGEDVEEEAEPEEVPRMTQHIRESLDNFFSCTAPLTGPTWHTAPYNQIIKENGHAIGCGNTAWSIVYAYWRQFKNRGSLFDGANVNTTNWEAPEIAACMTECAEHTETRDVIGGQGLTWPWKMPNAIQYAKDKRYGSSTCDRVRGTEYSKFDRVLSSLRADRPVILEISTAGVGRAADHYVVIETADKSQYRRYSWGVWRDRDVRYHCNWGWGDRRLWIYARDWGANAGFVYGSYSVYLINIP